MEINVLEKIELVCGAAGVEVGEDGFTLSRMTPELTELYSYSEAAEIRASCPSGIRIAFVSNTSFVAMQVKYGRKVRERFAIDIVVDRVQRMTFNPSEETEIFSFSTEIPGAGDKRIEIFLPVMVECTVQALEIEDGASLATVEEVDRMMFIGDSITQGIEVTAPALAYPAQVAAALEKDFHNIAVGGAKMNANVGKLALDLKWKTAFVAFGINDFNQSRPLAEFTAETEGLLKHLSSRKRAKIYVITPLPWAGRTTPNELGLSPEDYRQAIRDAAGKITGVKVIEGAELVPDDAALYVDNVHPNDSGMTLLAEKLLEKIKQ
ncbi:MAG: SGNH/GDSL hydrolase family protein [Victivallaceae bacterium]